MKRFYAIVLAIVLMLPGWSGMAEASAPKALTLMIYMTGSDLESGYGAASRDIEEMVLSGFNPKTVNVVLMTGGTRRWDNGQDVETIQIGKVRAEQVINKWTGTTMNMGDANTLSFFLDYAVREFPAKEYALILWDHGGGPMEGVCYDELNNMDALSLNELTQALAGSAFNPDNRLSWIGFDACLMASVETAGICAPYASYMIASQETEPGTGWDYSFLNRLEAGISGDEVGRIIVDGFVDVDDDKKSLTLSCVNLARIGDVFDGMDAMFEALEHVLSENTFSRIAIQRQDAKSFGRTTTFSNYDLVDLYHLSQQFEQEAPVEAETLQAAIRSAVVYSRTNLENANGLSMYSPFYNKMSYHTTWKEEYKSWGLSPTYDRYMNKYADIWMGKQLADWGELHGSAKEVRESNAQTILLTLRDEQLANYASARLVILQETGEGGCYYNVNEIDDISLVGNTLLTTYDFSALYAVDEHGKMLTDAYPFQKMDDYYYVRIILESESFFNLHYFYDYNAKEAGYEAKEVYLQYKLGDDDTLELVNVIQRAQTPDQLNIGRQISDVDPEKWPYVFFLNDSCIAPKRDTEGRLLPVDEWDVVRAWDRRHSTYVDSDNNPVQVDEFAWDFILDEGNVHNYRTWGEVDNSKPWSLKRLRGRFSGMDLYAQYIVTDTQGHEMASELIPLDNPFKYSSMQFGQTVYSADGVDVTLSGVEVVDTTLERGLSFRMTIRNDSDSACAFGMNLPIVNQTPYESFIGLNQYVEAHTTMDLYMNLPADKLPPLEDGFIHSFSFIPVLGLPNEESDPIRSADRITLDMEMDMRPLNIMSDWPDFDRPMSEAVVDGIRVKLVSLSEQADGALKGTLHLINESGEERQIYTTTGLGFPHILVNGHYMLNNLTMFAGLAFLPGSETYCGFTIDRNSYPRRNSAYASFGRKQEDIFDYWGVDVIEKLGFIFSIRHEITTGFTDGVEYIQDLWLDEPLRLNHNPTPQPDTITLMDLDGLRLELRSVAWENGVARLYTDLRADAVPPMLTLDSCRLNGIPATAVILPDYLSEADSFPLDPWQDMTARAIIELTPPEYYQTDTLEQIDLCFGTLSIPGGFNDANMITLEVVSGAALPSSHLEADQFRVSYGTLADTEPVWAQEGPDARALWDSLQPELIPEMSQTQNIVSQAVTLGIPLSKERIRESDSLSILLLLPVDDDPNVWRTAAVLDDALRWSDGMAYMDYCGFLPVIHGTSLPVTCNISQDGSTTLFDMDNNIYLSGIDSGRLRGYVSYDELSLYLNAVTNETGVAQCETSMHYLEDREPSRILWRQFPIITPSRLYDGYSFPTIDASRANEMLAADFEAGVLNFDFVPAAELKPKVMLIGTYTYGSGYSYIFSYEEAVQPDEPSTGAQ